MAVTAAIPEQREAAIANLRDYLEAHGAVPAAIARQTAGRLGVSERTIYRWLAKGEAQRRKRASFTLTQDQIELFFEWRGNVNAVHRELTQQGVDVSANTLRRAFEKKLTPAERAYAVEGVEGFRRHSLYLRMEQSHRNELWQMDHYEIPVWVSVPRRTRPEKAWLTALIDGYSRAVPGYAISLQPTTAEVLAAVRAAVILRRDDDIGGIPEAILWDNGKEFLSDAVTNAIVDLGCYCAPTAAYSPHQKGKIERFFSTVETEFCRRMPFYVDGPRAVNGRLFGAGGFLSLEELVAEFDKWFYTYNRERVHSARGVTPYELWSSDPHPLRVVPEEKLRHLLLASEERKVRKTGVLYANTDFFAPELQGLVGEAVEIRYEPNDHSKIWIYHDGEFLCEAVPHDQLSDEVRRAHLGERRQQQQRASQIRRTADRKARRGRIKPMTEAGPVIDTVEPVEPAKRRKRRLNEQAAADLLDLEGVNEVVDLEASSE